MSTYKFTVANIDKTLPTVKKTVILKEKCDKCTQYTSLKVEITANERQVVVAQFKGACGNKKCKAPMAFMTTVNMPRKI